MFREARFWGHLCLLRSSEGDDFVINLHRASKSSGFRGLWIFAGGLERNYSSVGSETVER